ncbi:hypothetical protein DYB36_008101 [Aphanomyces astaci]|uniref:Uncharacterized protein n=1 Tax=Aphanomyces astaci TaxID=112090 RepID=A0A397AMN4_APHAT|nr:hypothetical protein DYB36_008101 [Aphanomyces astaci]
MKTPQRICKEAGLSIDLTKDGMDVMKSLVKSVVQGDVASAGGFESFVAKALKIPVGAPSCLGEPPMTHAMADKRLLPHSRP